MKKKIILALSLALAIATSVGCGNQSAKNDNDKIKVLCTSYPQYDWAKQVAKDISGVEISLLNASGTDMHNYQATAEDIFKIADSDLFIYVGGESEEWVNDALKSANGSDVKALNLLETLGDNAKEEEVVEGMQADEDEHEEEEAEEGTEYDEHVWLSLKNAEILVDSINDTLCSMDADSSKTYTKNSEDYIESIKALDMQFEDTISSAKNDTLLFGDRFPFRYLFSDYNLTYYAAFIGCSAETEASFETIAFLSEKVNDLSLSYVMTLEGSDNKIANTIIENTTAKNQKILSLNSMQSITKTDIDNGITYLEIMENNLNVLSEALN